MIVVSNTSPIINLAMINQLNLLERLYGTVIIPPAVYDEIVTGGAGQPGADVVQALDGFEVRPVSNRPMVINLAGSLDLGEAEAIVLAVELGADLLLIDERQARIVAKRLGVNHIGLLAVLVQAKHAGLIRAVGPLVERLRSEAGFWISEDVLQHLLKIAGENA